MITSNVLQRTFHIKCGTKTGTAFAIDVNSRQYLVTAHHVVNDLNSGATISVFHESQWKDIQVEIVGIGTGKVDIAVLSTSFRLSPGFSLEPTLGGLVLGQQVYFLGYPYSWDGGGQYINRGIPLPFVRFGIVSAIQGSKSSPNEPLSLFIDAYGNPGFSGGPVVWKKAGEEGFKVGGVVAHHPTILAPIVDAYGNHILDSQGQPIGYTKENPSFVVAMAIGHAVDLIEANPIGYPLTSGTSGS